MVSPLQSASFSAQSRINLIALFAPAVLCIGGLLVLAGWQWQIPLLRGDFRGSHVAPMTALCFILLGVTVGVMTAIKQPGPYAVAACRFLFALVLLMALETFVEYATGYTSGLHRLFFAHRMNDWQATVTPGRFSLPAAIGFVFAAASALAHSWRQRKAGFFLAIPVGIVAYFGIIGHLYGVAVLYGRIMALNTALLFFITFILLDTFSPESGVLGALMSERPGGLVFRRLLPLIVALIPLLGLTRIELQKAGFVSLEVGTAALVISTTVVFLSVTIALVRKLDEMDSKRSAAIHAMQHSEKLAVAGKLASTVAHEINNPLEAITNLAFLVRQDQGLQPHTREYLKTMDQELIRVSAMARRTLGFYRESSVQGSVSLNKVLHETSEVYGGLAARLGVKLELELDSDPLVFAVPSEIRQIVLNLYVNALEAAPSPGGVVIARTLRNQHYAILEIEDNGPGIPQQIRESIFTPFFTTKLHTGNGIGLWISRQLAKNNRGALEFQSRQGSTIFSLRLPLESTAD
jgi:signal transduction histidine kinase